MPVRKFKNEFVEYIDAIPLPTPREMFHKLEKYGYRGQERARRAVCLMAFRHISKIKKIYVNEIDRNKLPDKENMLLIGPTGCGKTFLIELLFWNILKIPAVIVDITSYSETGYVGQDVPTILTKLLFASKQLIDLANIGIVCIDEFDKIASGKNTGVFAGQGTTKDVTGYGVQRELLKMFESSDVDVPGELSHSTYAPRVVINTKDIPFIACGAFSGFREVIKYSSSGGYSSENALGFTRIEGEAKSEGITARISREDIERAAHFESYGIMPELIGRFSRIVPFDPLSEKTLKEILQKNTVQKYAAELALEGIELIVEDAVYDDIVKRCIKKETGARGLKSIITEYLEDACFEAFSSAGKCKEIRIKQMGSRIETVLK